MKIYVFFVFLPTYLFSMTLDEAGYVSLVGMASIAEQQCYQRALNYSKVLRVQTQAEKMVGVLNAGYKKGKRKKQIPCLIDGCKRTYSSSLTRQQHIRIKHNLTPLHVCTYCDLSLAGSIALKAHEAICKKNNNRQPAIRKKKRSVRKKIYYCDACSKDIAVKMACHFDRHHVSCKARNETGKAPEKNVSCSYPECDKKFGSIDSRNQHIRSEHEKRYACILCSRNFQSDTRLREHKEIHEKDIVA